MHIEEEDGFGSCSERMCSECVQYAFKNVPLRLTDKSVESPPQLFDRWR